ncbi:MAG: Gfo/Idh/MocA family oxidoreductase [Cytophagaceae bacterium]
MKSYKVAIIGFGKGGETYHAPFIHAVPSLSIYKVLERNRQRSREIYPNVQVVKTLDEVLSDDEVDVVVVTVPNIDHYSIARQALLAGKHVVVDKPFTITYKEASELINLAEKQDCLLTVYHNRRLDSGIQTLKKLLSEDLLGKIKSFSCRFDRYRPEVTGTWREQNVPGAGLLYDLGSHLIDHILYLFGKPLSVTADVQKQRAGTCADDYFHLKFRYPDFEAEVGAGMLVKDASDHIVCVGEKATFVVDVPDLQEAALKQGIMPVDKEWSQAVSGQKGLLKFAYGHTETIDLVQGDYCRFYANLAEAIDRKEPLLVSPVEASEVIRVIEGCL